MDDGDLGGPDARSSDRLEPYLRFVDERDSRPVSPNSPEGEIRAMAAFAAGVGTTSPARRLAIRGVVWLILLGIGLAIIAGVVTGVRTF